MFLGHVSLEVIVTVPLVIAVMEFMTQTVGRWSLMSFTRTLLTKLLQKF